MTPLREALILPCLFLTVALLGGLRVGDEVRLIPPSLVALVLATMLMSALVRSGALAPERLMHQQRTALENLSGLAVILTLFGASAQVFNLVTPDSGLLHLLVSVFFVVQLLTTVAAVRDRLSMLRSLTVLLTCAFVLRFVALESLYAPGRGLMKRVMTALMEGITLGALEYEPAGVTTGYVAFVALLLYVIGLVLVGTGGPSGTGGPPAVRATSTSVIAHCLILPLLAMASACGTVATDGSASVPAAALSTPAHREAVLASARVWHPPSLPVSVARLDDNPSQPWAYRAVDEVSCRFVVQPVGGTTSKFNCELPGGEIVKVKYGTSNPELFAEVAATRLLTALGFAADHMYLVARVRCYGCPRFPFQALRCHARTAFDLACFAGGPTYTRAVVFQPAVLERRIEGQRIESVEGQGWAWYELDRIEPAHGGSARAEIDALRLMAVFLAHWDNKAENQRLVCRGPTERGQDTHRSDASPVQADRVSDGTCGASVALIQDLGATFGPTKLDLANWKHSAIWRDARACHVGMEHFPFGGGTFPEAQISEEGRMLLVSLIGQLSPAQVRQLFAGSGVSLSDGIAAEGRDADAWGDVFMDKVRQLQSAGPCPQAAALTRQSGSF
jgi:hypothetical protein